LITKITVSILVFLILIRFSKKLFHFQLPWTEYFLDSDYRRKGQPAERIISRSGIQRGMKVLEVGCGSGTYTIPIAQTVGKTGKVYGIDIKPKVLLRFQKKLSQKPNQDLDNVYSLLENACHLPFQDESFDRVLMVSVLPEIPDGQKALAEIKRVLKPHGILAVTEVMADPDYPFKQATIAMGEKAGFDAEQFSGNLWEYTVCFRKS
jgi:ubiquinone/menaquinone biosynthesis C-methylase UbiE